MDKITTWYDDIWREWYACLGDFDADMIDGRYVPTVPVASGLTEAEARDNLLDMMESQRDATRDQMMGDR